MEEKDCGCLLSPHPVSLPTVYLLLKEGFDRRGGRNSWNGHSLTGVRKSLQPQTLSKLISLVRFGVKTAHCLVPNIYFSLSSFLRATMSVVKGHTSQSCV